MKGSSTKEPLLIILGMIVIFGFMYGPIKNSKLNKTGTATTSNSTTATKSTSTTKEQSIAEKIKAAENSIKKIGSQIDENPTGNESPYRDKITLSTISNLNNKDPSKEYILIRTNLGKTETLKITGWYFRSEVTGYYVIIPGAALLPFPSNKNESPIVLQKGDKLYLNKGFSPINTSFRTNKCTGYFEENRTFTPSIAMKCPRPEDEKLPQFSSVSDRQDECADVISSIPRCSTVGSSFTRDLPDTVGESCKNYITTQINYNTCVAKHFGDTDFPGNEYRVYLNKFGPLWRTNHDKINLHDENGLIVGTIEY